MPDYTEAFRINLPDGYVPQVIPPPEVAESFDAEIQPEPERKPLDFEYEFTSTDAVLRSDGFLIQNWPSPEREEYEFWVSKGNTAAPYVSVELTVEQRRSAALKAVDEQHQQVLLVLTGNPTDVEKASWPGKVELAKAILSESALSIDQQAFLSQRGINSPSAKTAYANEVMQNSAKYWALVGLADKVRSEAKARINAVTDNSEWEDCYNANVAARDAALAAVMNQA